MTNTRFPINRNKVSLIDAAGREPLNTIFGEIITAARKADILVQFQYGVSAQDVNSFTTGSGLITNSESFGVIETVATSSKARITSVRSLRYKAGYDGVIYFTAQFSTGVTDTEQYIGLYDDDNGYRIGFNGVDFCLIRRSNGVEEETVTQTNFNKNTLDGTQGITIDFTKLTIYRISYGWLGIAPITFEVYAGHLDTWVPFHTMDLSNSLEEVTIRNPTLPMRMEVTSGSSAVSSVIMKTASWNASTVNFMDTNGGDPATRHFATSSNHASISTTLTNIVTLKSNNQFKSITNHVQAKLTYISLSTEGNKPVIFSVRKNATLSSPVSAFTDHQFANSTVLVSSNLETVAGGSQELEFALGKTDSFSEEIGTLGITFRANDTISIGARATTAGAVDVSVGIRWAEEF